VTLAPYFAATGSWSSGPHPFSLYVNSVDILKASGGGVSIASIKISETANGNAMMSFEVDDPLKLLSLADWAEVRFMDHQRDVPLFAGYILLRGDQPDFGQQGRKRRVDCVDYSVMLDRLVSERAMAVSVADNLFEPTTAIQRFISCCVAVPLGISANVAFTAPNLWDGIVMNYHPALTLADQIPDDGITIPAGTSLRNGIEQIIDVTDKIAAPPSSLPLNTGAPRFLYVDFLKRIRCDWVEKTVGPAPFTVTDAQAQTYADRVRSHSPTAWWKLADPGPLAYDQIGSRHLTVTGGVITLQRPLVANEDSYSMDFDGVDDVCDLTAPVITATDNWTLEAIVRPDVVPQFALMVYNGRDNNGYGFGLRAIGSDSPGSRLHVLHGGSIWIDTTFDMAAGTDYHVVVKRDAGTTKVRVNGVQVYSAVSTAPSTPTARFSVGAQRNSTDSAWVRLFNGRIAHPAVYGSVLSDANADAHNTARQATDIFVEQLDYEVDSSLLCNAVYVQGANAAGSGWVRDFASIAAYGERQDTFNEPDSDTTTKRNHYGRSYLADRKDPLIRGSFTVKNLHGWKVRQLVTITNAAVNLSGDTFVIQTLDTEITDGAGGRVYEIHFGSRASKSLTRLIRSLAA
jgi:concanavalin A-like lectin/glucanase superfamily protein